MKRLKDYTNEELTELNQSQIETLIDLECAHEGIPLLPERPEKPETNKPEEDLTVYYISDVKLKNKEDAQQIVNLLNGMARMRRDWNTNGYDLEEDSVSFKLEKVFSSECQQKYKAQTAAAKEIEDRYKSAKKEYDDIVKQRKAIIDEVSDTISDAYAEFRKIEQYKKQYARYLELAEGEKDIALNFMKAAHPDEDEYIDSIILKISDDIMLGNKIIPDTRVPLPG